MSLKIFYLKNVSDEIKTFDVSDIHCHVYFPPPVRQTLSSLLFDHQNFSAKHHRPKFIRNYFCEHFQKDYKQKGLLNKTL